MKNYKIAAAIIAVIVLFIGAGYKLYLKKVNEKIFTGTIEVTKADITPKVSGYLEKINFSEGETVEKGTQLAKIEATDYQIQFNHDQAALAAAEAVLTDLQKGARKQEIAQAAAQSEAASSAYDKANKDWLRYRALYDSGAVAKQQYDEALNARTVAQKQLEAARAALDLLQSGTREDQIKAQEQEVKRCRYLVEQSRNNIAYTDLKSPVDGVVLTKNYEAGEFVSAGTAVMTVAELADCWVKIYIPSEMLGKVSYGQQVAVMIDAYPDKTFTGIIKEISDQAEYTPRQSITARERANLVFAVKVKLLNDEKIFKPGMIADVMFDEK